jgi:imidazolonepropionase-like amidohydrolase
VGTNNMYKLARKHGLKVAFGTDLIFSPAVAARQGLMIGNMTRWYNGSEILRMVTGRNGELLALSGERNPYPAKLGVLERGAWADLLVVGGNPLDDVGLLADPDKNLKLIMKDGRIYKDALQT